MGGDGWIIENSLSYVFSFVHEHLGILILVVVALFLYWNFLCFWILILHQVLLCW